MTRTNLRHLLGIASGAAALVLPFVLVITWTLPAVAALGTAVIFGSTSVLMLTSGSAPVCQHDWEAVLPPKAACERWMQLRHQYSSAMASVLHIPNGHHDRACINCGAVDLRCKRLLDELQAEYDAQKRKRKRQQERRLRAEQLVKDAHEGVFHSLSQDGELSVADGGEGQLSEVE